jgi:hypothetical protein
MQRCAQTHSGSLRRRSGANYFLPADAAEAPTSWYWTNQPSRSGIDQRSQYRASALSKRIALVTHDHDVIDEVVTRIWNFHHDRLEDFKGTYEQFLAQADQLV